MFKRIFSFVMTAVLVAGISGCGEPRSAVNTSTPNYQEKEISSNTNLKAPGGSRVNSKNQLVVYDRGSESPRYAILDLEGNPVGEIKCDFKGDGSIFALDSSDNLYVVVQGFQSEGVMKNQLYIINPKGETLKTIELKTAVKGETRMLGMGIADIAVDSKGNAYLVKPQENIEVIDKNGQSVKTIGSQGYQGICVDEEDNIIASNMNMQNGGNTLEKINASTGKSIWKQDIVAARNNIRIGGGQSKISYVKEDKCVYLIDNAGVKKYDSNGSSVGTILDFTSFTILGSGYYIADFAVDSAKNIYVFTMDMQMGKGMVNGPKVQKGEAPKGQMKIAGANKAEVQGEEVQSKSVDSKQGPIMRVADVKFELYKYSIQTGEKAAVEKKTITVLSRSADRFLQTAASKFQKANPDYKIDIQSPPEEQSTEERDKYINSVNTQILSGKGPDIIFTSVLPYEKYVSKNILANLSEMMAEDKSFDIGKYYSNIIDAMKINGNIYALPISFSFNSFMANKDILEKSSISIDDSKWTWNDFKEIAQKVSDSKTGRTALPNVGYSDLLEIMTRGNFDKFIDRQAKKSNFDSQEFIDLLNIIKSFGDGNLASKGDKQEMGAVMDAAQRGALVFYPEKINEYMFYGFFKNVFNGKLALLDYPSDGKGSSAEFSAEYSYGINNKSKHKDKAWEFLKILLSDDIQSSMDLRGFSVNKAAQQKKAEQAMEMTANGNVKIMIKGGENSKPISPAQITQVDIDYIDKMIKKLKTHANVDLNVTKIVEDETKAFFSGSKTAEEVAKLIQNRVDTYLGE